MGGKETDPNLRMNEKSTVTDYPVKIVKTGLFIPADKLVTS
jgi:hypothetical protein